MIKLVETASFPDGTSKVTEKKFSSRFALERVFKKNPPPWEIVKNLRLFDEVSFIMPLTPKEGVEPGEFVTITIKIVNDAKKIILSNR